MKHFRRVLTLISTTFGKEREALGVKSLPISLNEAIKIARKSEFISELLGDKFCVKLF